MSLARHVLNTMMGKIEWECGNVDREARFEEAVLTAFTLLRALPKTIHRLNLFHNSRCRLPSPRNAQFLLG